MALTQAEINDLLQQFIRQYAGERPDYYGYAGECLSLAKRWFDVLKNGHLNGPMTAPLAPGGANGSGSDYWAQAPGSVLELFDKQNYNHDATYPAGSLFVNTGSHHIGIMLDNHPGQTQAYVFEQNADPDGEAAHSAMRAKNRIDGILVVKSFVPPAAPPAPKYQVIETYPNGKQIQLNKQPTMLWGMNFDFDYMDAHPIEQHDAGEIWTVTNKVRHSDGYDYYRRDGQVDGFNVADCSDYTPPPPKPYVAPAAPLEVPRVNYYELKTTVAYFGSAQDSQKDINAIGTLDKGTYVLLKTDATARQITKNNADTTTFWINDIDNKVPVPEPTLPVDPPKVVTEPVQIPPATTVLTDVTPAKKDIQWDWLNTDQKPTIYYYKGTAPVPIKDLEGTKPGLTMQAGLKGPISRYTIVNGTTYLIPDSEFKKGNAYGIPEMLMAPLHPNILQEAETDVIRFWDNFEELPKKVYTLISDISPVKRHEVMYKGKQLIDGFNARRKK